MGMDIWKIFSVLAYRLNIQRIPAHPSLDVFGSICASRQAYRFDYLTGLSGQVSYITIGRPGLAHIALKLRPKFALQTSRKKRHERVFTG